MKDSFSGYHPLVSFVYFLAVLLFSMFLTNPVCIAVSLLCGLCYAIYQNGRKSVRFGVMYLLPMSLLVMLINPAFNHQGVTILCYLPTGNPLTLEAIAYGAAAAGLMSSVLLWFSCAGRVITSDKFMYLFGRIIPSLSLVLSMAVRFVPRFIAQFGKVREAQRCIGRDIGSGTLKQRLKNLVRIFSIMVSWSLENSIETADSMRSRGYGLKGRTAYTLYRFEKRDILMLSAEILLTAYVLWGALSGELLFGFYPGIYSAGFSLLSASVYAAYFLLCAAPVIINIKEDRKWRYLRSKL